jgi:hypothetical protein
MTSRLIFGTNRRLDRVNCTIPAVIHRQGPPFHNPCQGVGPWTTVITTRNDSEQEMRPPNLRLSVSVVALVTVVSLFHAATVIIQQQDSRPVVLDMPPALVDDSTIVIPTRVYGAQACSLVPAWGRPPSTGPTSCVGKAPLAFANTTATFLTCDTTDTPTLKPRTHPGVTIALLYFAKPALLFRQLEVFATYPASVQSTLTLLIIDDGSPDGLRASNYLNVTSYPSLFRIRLARITTEIDWNIGGARNLAFYLVDTPKTLLLDIDIIVPWPAMEAALSWPLVDPKTGTQLAHRFNRRRPDGSENKHPAVCMIRTEAYWENGGCDEDFCGSYGFTDIHFWFRWKADKSKAMVDHLDVFLEEFEMAACDPAVLGEARSASCKSVRSKQVMPNRKLKKNHALYKSKTKKGCWSNRFLNFRWMLEG